VQGHRAADSRLATSCGIDCDDKNARDRRAPAITQRRNRQQRQLLNWTGRHHRRNPLSPRFDNPTREQIQSCRSDPIRGNDGVTLPLIDHIPRVTANQNQTALPPVRSLGDLSSHCRHLHTVCSRSTAWRLELDTL